MAEIRPQPQSPALGALARMLGAARDAAGRVRIDSQLLGQTSLADLLSLPGAASLAEDVSYFGPAAMLRPGSGRTLQTFKIDPRVLDAADVALNVSPLGAMAAKGAARAARPVARAAGEAVNRAMLTGEGRLAAALAPVAPMPVVKPKGGNWLAGSIESAVEPLKSNRYGNAAEENIAALTGALELNPYMSDTMRQELQRQLAEQQSGAAINRWLDKKLAGYLRNEMATPEDPLRALAERGVLHFEPQDPVLLSDTAFARTAAGFPRHGMARSQLATDWEALSDRMVKAQTAGRLIAPEYENPAYGRRDAAVADFLSRDPWLAKVPPETPVYRLDANPGNELGFDHLVDELRNALDPASGLPREMRLQPKDLDKITVPDAVERVAKINAWRAEQKAAADLARANNAASVEYRAYQTVPGTDLPNEKGLRWVELKAPSNESMPLEERKALIARLRAEGGDPETWPREQLEAALKYEGETMGHCVGGYCPDVMEGRSRIFSLRDAKGEPHVTVEVRPDRQRDKYYTDWMRQQPEAIQDEVTAAAIEYNAANPKLGYGESLNKVLRDRIGDVPDEIVQIKGKANRAPKEDYLPFVQDFVRSGQWGRVGDLPNTGLIEIDPDSDLAARIKASGNEPPKFVTQDELTSLLRQNADPAKGYAEGGPVIKEPSLFNLTDYAAFQAARMFPKDRGQDDRRDAARHMLAAGMLARRFEPETVERMGRWYEYKESPGKAIGTLFGGSMPPDYDMDTHNNQVGIMLGRQAKDQADLERLVRKYAREAALNEKNEGQAMIRVLKHPPLPPQQRQLYAGGGIVRSEFEYDPAAVDARAAALMEEIDAA